jgi:hypothetical protein
MTSMKESYCGLCDHCQLSGPDFQAAAAKVKTYVGQLPPFWQQQCLQEGRQFSLDEFHRGLDWFLGLGQCAGCKAGGGLESCTIRNCAQKRRQDHCHDCSDYESCGHLIIV